jgi:hypothetical protein
MYKNKMFILRFKNGILTHFSPLTMCENLTTWFRIFPERLIVTQMIKKFSAFTEAEGLSMC